MARFPPAGKNGHFSASCWNLAVIFTKFFILYNRTEIFPGKISAFLPFLQFLQKLSLLTDSRPVSWGNSFLSEGHLEPYYVRVGLISDRDLEIPIKKGQKWSFLVGLGPKTTRGNYRGNSNLGDFTSEPYPVWGRFRQKSNKFDFLVEKLPFRWFCGSGKALFRRDETGKIGDFFGKIGRFLYFGKSVQVEPIWRGLGTFSLFLKGGKGFFRSKKGENALFCRKWPKMVIFLVILGIYPRDLRSFDQTTTLEALEDFVLFEVPYFLL